MNEVMRQEHKYLLSQEEFRRLDHRLGEVLREDPHNGPLGYTIRSLYFDTIVDGDYWDKEDGVELRRKLRLRCYSPSDSTALLEMKQKQGSDQRKRSLPLPREAARRLCAGDYAPLLGRREPFAAECYGLMQKRCYRPKAVVEYRRKAYVAKENNIRVTFDHSLRGTQSRWDLFAPDLAMAPIQDPGSVVLEVKYDGFLLSYIKDLLGLGSRSELSLGKYNMGRVAGLYGFL